MKNYSRSVSSAAGTLIFSAAVFSSTAAEAPAAPTDAWETSAAAGLTLTRGNSDTLLFNANLWSQKKWERNELSFGVDASYGENNSIKNTESLHGFGQYNRLFTDRCYGYARLDGLHDSIADVEYRVTLSAGGGYYFIKNDTTRLSAEAGPGIVFEKQGGRSHEYLVLRVAERFEHKLNDRARIWQSAEYLPQVDNFNNYILNGEIGVEAGLTSKLSLRSYLQDTYDNEPAPGRKQNDLKLVAGIAYKF